MDTYKVVSEFKADSFCESYPVGTILKMEKINERFCRFGLEQDTDLVFITGIKNFLSHAEPVKA